MIKQDPCKDYIEKEREMLTKGRVEALGTHGKQTLNEIEADNNSNSRVFFFFSPFLYHIPTLRQFSINYVLNDIFSS